MHKILKHIIKNALTLIETGAGLLSPAVMLLDRLMSGLLPKMNKDPINAHNDDLHHETLEAYQRKMIRAKILKKHLFLLQELQ